MRFEVAWGLAAPPVLLPLVLALFFSGYDDVGKGRKR